MSASYVRVPCCELCRFRRFRSLAIATSSGWNVHISTLWISSVAPHKSIGITPTTSSLIQPTAFKWFWIPARMARQSLSGYIAVFFCSSSSACGVCLSSRAPSSVPAAGLTKGFADSSHVAHPPRGFLHWQHNALIFAHHAILTSIDPGHAHLR